MDTTATACPSCARPIGAAARFCIQCGSQLEPLPGINPEIDDDVRKAWGGAAIKSEYGPFRLDFGRYTPFGWFTDGRDVFVRSERDGQAIHRVSLSDGIATVALLRSGIAATGVLGVVATRNGAFIASESGLTGSLRPADPAGLWDRFDWTPPHGKLMAAMPVAGGRAGALIADGEQLALYAVGRRTDGARKIARGLWTEAAQLPSHMQASELDSDGVMRFDAGNGLVCAADLATAQITVGRNNEAVVCAVSDRSAGRKGNGACEFVEGGRGGLRVRLSSSDGETHAEIARIIGPAGQREPIADLSIAANAVAGSQGVGVAQAFPPLVLSRSLWIGALVGADLTVWRAPMGMAA